MAGDTLLRDREEVGSEGGGRNEKEIVKLLIGSRMLRRRRIRNLLLAHLLREGRERDDDDEDEGGGEEHRLARLLIAGGMLRRRRVRRLLLARLLKERSEREDDDDDDDDDDSGRTRGAATITGWSAC